MAAAMTAVTGRVVDPAGRGVPGVWVYPTGAGARVGGVHTDRDGGWRLDLPPGTWQVRRSGREPLDVHVGDDPVDTDEQQGHTELANVPGDIAAAVPSRDAIAALLARRREAT